MTFRSPLSFTSMTVQLDTEYAADLNVTGFDASWLPTAGSAAAGRLLLQRVPHGTGRATNYSVLGDQRLEQGRKLGRQCNHRTEHSDAPDISLNDVSFTSMTVHMETVYAEDKNVTGFDVSWEPHHGAMDGSDASNVYITGSGRSYNIYFLGEECRRNQ
jgi:hypothetical protein